MVCTLTEKEGVANWCERHKMHHKGHYAQYAVDPGEKGERFRRWWDQQSATKPNWLRHPNLARQCIHLDPHCLTNDEASHLQETAWRLNTNCRSCTGNTNLQKCHGGSGVDGYTTVAWCSAHCRDWKRAVAKPPTSEFIRNLLYHIYPVAGNGHWQWNVEQLCGRLKCFNGKKIVAIVTDPITGRLPDPDGPNCPDGCRNIQGCDSAADVKAEFARRWPHDDIEFLEMENDPALREVKTLIPMLSKVLSDDPSQITLYAQAKGTTRHKGHIARRWTEALYEIMFDYFPLAEEQLKTYPVTGCFKKLGAGWSAEQSHSDFHYSGSWAFFRNAELWARDWEKVDQFWSGVEPYWSQHFRQVEAGCMFHTAQVPACNLYNASYWKRTIIPAFNQWRIDNAKYRTTLWPK